MTEDIKTIELTKLNYVDRAETVIKSLNKDKRGNISLKTNQIRNILTFINELYTAVSRNHNEKLSTDIQSRTAYIKMKLIYYAGRDDSGAVKDLLNKSGLIKYLDRTGDSRSRLLLVCSYTEALVAYHKYYSSRQ